MRCPHCRAEHLQEDMYCRHCGTDLTSSTDVVSTSSVLPAILHTPELPRRVAAGVGAVALGVGLELLRRGVLARLHSPRTLEPSLPFLSQVKEILTPQNANKVRKLPKGYEVQETVVVMRRVIRRS